MREQFFFTYLGHESLGERGSEREKTASSEKKETERERDGRSDLERGNTRARKAGCASSTLVQKRERKRERGEKSRRSPATVYRAS